MLLEFVHRIQLISYFNQSLLIFKNNKCPLERSGSSLPLHICQDFPWNRELRFTAQFENLPPKKQLPVQSDRVEEGLWVMEVLCCISRSNLPGI